MLLTTQTTIIGTQKLITNHHNFGKFAVNKHKYEEVDRSSLERFMCEEATAKLFIYHNILLKEITFFGVGYIRTSTVRPMKSPVMERTFQTVSDYFSSDTHICTIVWAVGI